MRGPRRVVERQQRAAKPGRKRDFTRFVRLLLEDESEPRRERLEEVWEALRRALRSELRRRHLWHGPPSYLGVYGRASWLEPFAEGAAGDRFDALDELTADCYSYLFLTRLQSLAAHVRVGQRIEALVFVGIRQFLFERQRSHDPVGFRVYRTLRWVVSEAVEAGTLEVAGGEGRLGNTTLLSFTAGSGSRLEGGRHPWAALWADVLVPDVITSRGAARRAMLGRLEQLLLALRAEGIAAFTLGELVEPLKNEVRARWGAILDHDLGAAAIEAADPGLREVVRAIWPEDELEQRDHFEKLVEDVLRRVEREACSARTRDYLARLWRFTIAFAADTGSVLGGKYPSARRIAGELQIPRARLPELFATLRRLVQGFGDEGSAARRRSQGAR